MQETIIFANAAGGTHCGSLTRTAAVAIGRRDLLVAPAAVPGSVQPATAGALPIGTVSDEAEAGDPVAVQLLGGSNTLTLVAAAPVTAGAPLVSNGDGRVKELPAADGSYVQVGMALDGAGAEETVEALTCFPTVVTVED
jgi:hypothetical protein